MVMIPNPPRFFERESVRHVLWQITLVDQLLETTRRLLLGAVDAPTKAKAREQINLLLDRRLELMQSRDALAAEKGQA